MAMRVAQKLPKLSVFVASVVCVLLVGTLIGWGASRSLDYQRQASSQIRQNALISGAMAPSKCAAIAGDERALCVRALREAKREFERSELDLAAQRQSATWAGIMGIVAVLGTGLSIIGVALLWTTFRETRRTAEIAQNNLEAYVRAERGFAHVETATMAANSGLLLAGPCMAFEITNSGRSGARIKRIEGGWRPNGKRWEWDQESGFVSVFPKFCERGGTVYMVGPRIPESSRNPVFCGFIEYETLSLPRCRTHFAFTALPTGEAEWGFIRLSVVEGMPADT